MRLSLLRLKKYLYLRLAGYFWIWAGLSLRRWNPRIIAVTGSVGKTTMLHLMHSQLGKRAHISFGANSAYGVAFDILGLDSIRGSKLRWIWLVLVAPFRAFSFRHIQEFYVAEVDGERPGETEYIARRLKPEATLWLSLGRSHAVYFDGQVKAGKFTSVEEAIAHEFAWLPRLTQKLVLIDGESKAMGLVVDGVKANVESVNVSGLKSYEVWPDSTRYKTSQGEFSFGYPMPRDFYVQLLMLEKLCAYLDEPVDYSASGFYMPPGRSSFFEGKNGLRIIDSSYNAHLISMKSTLSMFREMHTSNKWVVIGDIIEQGEGEKREHERLGKLLADMDFDKYILVGRRTHRYTLPRLNELTKKPCHSFEHASDALKYLEENLKGKETVLFKGSQFLEGIIEPLLKNPDDAQRLCRREPLNVKRRQAWGLPG